MKIIGNPILQLTLDDHGHPRRLLDKRSGLEYLESGAWWRLVVDEGDSLEVEIRGRDADGEVTVDGSCFEVRYSGLRTHTGHDVDIGVVVSGRLDGEDLHLAMTVENRTADRTIRECHFPLLRLSEAAAGMDWHESALAGCRNGPLREQAFTPLYKAMEQRYHRILRKYPSVSAATNCFALEGGGGGLYFGCHDPSFTYTVHMVELEDRRHFNLGMVRTPLLRPGEATTLSGFVVAAYRGTWCAAADKYRAWADGWFRPEPPPGSVRDMAGWHRIIMRSQYGENFFRYDDLERVFRDGLDAGLDTLFMFGWHRGGHDADYPEYVPSPELGGEAALRNAIARVRAAGGKVILYANGQLIDRNSEYYRHGPGAKVSTKDGRGNEYQETYSFSGRGVFQQVYGNRTFVTACPSQAEWVERMKRVVDAAHDFGCDGVFFDQLGNGSVLCCDPSHGHPVPHFGIMNDKSAMVAELRAYAKSRKPSLSFGVELVTDVIARHVDYIHSLTGGNAVVNPDWEKRGEKPRVVNDMRWFRYIFPEIPLTNREIRDDTDIERRVNRMLLLNLLADVEVFRCQETLAAAPKYRDYLAKANALRARHAARLAGARYRACARHHIDNDEMDSDGHECPDGTVAVFVTQSHRPRVTAKVEAPGMQLAESDFLGEGSLLPDGRVRLGKHGLALLFFRPRDAAKAQ